MSKSPSPRTDRRRSAGDRRQFAFFGDWSERYQYLIDLGQAAGLPDAWKTDANRLHGCQSMVWIVALEGDAARLDFARRQRLWRSSPVLIYLALRVYSGRSAGRDLATEPDYIAAIGLAKHLSPTRSNGLACAAGLHPRARPRAALRRMNEVPASPLSSAGFRWLMLYRICTLLSYQIVAVTVGWQRLRAHPRPVVAGPDRTGGSDPVLLRRAVSAIWSTTCHGAAGRGACAGLALNALALAMVAAGVIRRCGDCGRSRGDRDRRRGAFVPRPGAHNALFARGAAARAIPNAAPAWAAWCSRWGWSPGRRSVACWSAAPASRWPTAWRCSRAAATRAAGDAGRRSPPSSSSAARCSPASPKVRFVFSNQISSPRWRWTCSRCCSAGDIAGTPAFIKDVLHAGPEHWASCAARPRSARSRWRCGCRGIRCRRTRAASCWPR